MIKIRKKKLINIIKTENKLILFIYLYMFIMPWNFVNGQFGTLTMLLFIAWIIVYKRRTFELSLKILKCIPLVLLCIYIIYTYITPFWSDSFIDGFKYINQYHKYYFLFIPILFTSLNMNQAKNSLKILVISFGLYSIFSLFIYAGLFTVEDSTSLNPKGIMGYSVTTQFMLIGSIACFVFAKFSDNNKLRIFFYSLSLLSFVALFINNSRTSQIAFLLSIITILLIHYKKTIFKPKVFISMGLFLIILSTLSLTLLDSAGKLDRYKKAIPLAKQALFEDYYTGSIGARIFFNKTGIEIISNNPIFGMGPLDNWIEHKKIQRNSPNFKHHYVPSFHSQHLDILTAFGLVGYLLLVASIVYLIYKLRENKEYFYIALSFYIPIFYISLANATFYKKPINYILISVFVLLSVIVYKKIREKSLDTTK